MVYKRKCPELVYLSNYEDAPDRRFWDTFPFMPLPNTVETDINVAELENLVIKLRAKLNPTEICRAEKLIYSLKNGASSCQKIDLPSCSIKNASSTAPFGKEITDTLAHWIKSGFVCGPFEYPPVSKLRINSLMAIPKDNKIRPVLNVSQPLGFSFNENIDDNKLEKVKMSSARNFGFTLKDCGINSRMSKFDMRDAYKNIPAPLGDLRLQGFKWLNKIFIENKQIFGARTAVANFDILGHTVMTLAMASCNAAPEFVHRHLDDVPVTGPCNSVICETFTKEYKKICKKINVKLAENCVKNEKAFSNKTTGKILGIWFDSTDLTWQLPQDKKEKTLTSISKAIKCDMMVLVEMQILMGNLNNVSMMCPFLNAYRKNLNDDLGKGLGKNSEIITLSEESKKDLLVWAGCLLDKCKKLPIPSRQIDPPLYCKTFSSDAAGYSDSNNNDKPGVATVGFNEDGELILAFQKFWGKRMISKSKDSNDRQFGRKTAFLEFVGLVMPFVLMPEKLARQHVILKVDNMSCYFGWHNKCMKNDAYTSILIRALYLLSAYNNNIVHVRHLPRKTSWDSCLVDRLSRESTTLAGDKKMLESFKEFKLPVFFEAWLDSPSVDWDIPNKLLSFVMNK